jgi:hypothetical protein
MSHLLRFTVMIMAVCAGSVIGVRWLGAFAPPDSSVMTLLRQQSATVDGRWCWQVLCPGRTQYAETERFLRTLPVPAGVRGTIGRMNSYPPTIWRYRAVWYVADSDVNDIVAQGNEHDLIVTMISVNTRGLRLTLADFLTTFGAPTTLRIYGQYFYMVLLCLDGGLCALIEPGTPHISLHTKVNGLTYLTSPNELPAWFEARPYRGLRRLDGR